jgi:hypothetical protein
MYRMIKDYINIIVYQLLAFALMNLEVRFKQMVRSTGTGWNSTRPARILRAICQRINNLHYLSTFIDFWSQNILLYSSSVT